MISVGTMITVCGITWRKIIKETEENEFKVAEKRIRDPGKFLLNWMNDPCLGQHDHTLAAAKRFHAKLAAEIQKEKNSASGSPITLKSNLI